MSLRKINNKILCEIIGVCLHCRVGRAPLSRYVIHNSRQSEKKKEPADMEYKRGYRNVK